jgi:hypothetical protein
MKLKVIIPDGGQAPRFYGFAYLEIHKYPWRYVGYIIPLNLFVRLFRSIYFGIINPRWLNDICDKEFWKMHNKGWEEGKKEALEHFKRK